MKLIVTTLGSQGDIVPFLTLGRELTPFGIDLTVATSRSHAPLVEGAGLSFLELIGEEPIPFDTCMKELRTSPTGIRRKKLYELWFRPQLANMATTIKRVHKDFDGVINYCFEVPPGLFPRSLRVCLDPPPNYVLSSMPPGSRDSVDIIAMNEFLVNPDGAWPSGYHFTGFWQPALYGANPCIQWRRVTGGQRPVALISMGSMLTFDLEYFESLIESAIDETEFNFIVVGGWSKMGSHLQSERVQFCQQLDLNEALKQSAVAVHHGGCGIVAAVTQHGVPSIVCPQFENQVRVANFLKRAGVVAGLFTDTPLKEPFVRALRYSANLELQANCLNLKNIMSSDGRAPVAAQIIANYMRTGEGPDVIPPSTGRTAPVTQPNSGEHRK